MFSENIFYVIYYYEHIAEFNLRSTEHVRRHLLSEGLMQRRIYLKFSTMYDVLHKYSDNINGSMILDELDSSG